MDVSGWGEDCEIEPVVEADDWLVFVVGEIGEVRTLLVAEVGDLGEFWEFVSVEVVARVGEVVEGEVATCCYVRGTRVLSPEVVGIGG